jgi:hypothetical protein
MRARITCAAILGLLVPATAAWAQMSNVFGISGFSATANITLTTGQSMSMKMYVSGTNVRSSLPGGMNGYSLIVGSTRTMYMVMGPSMCMQMNGLDPNRPNPFAQSGGTQVHEQPLGSDTVAGHPAKVVQITIQSASGQPQTMKAWRATDMGGFPLRVEIATAHGTIREEFTDVNLTPPPAEMFTAPSNCRPMPMMPH